MPVPDPPKVERFDTVPKSSSANESFFDVVSNEAVGPVQMEFDEHGNNILVSSSGKPVPPKLKKKKVRRVKKKENRKPQFVDQEYAWGMVKKVEQTIDPIWESSN